MNDLIQRVNRMIRDVRAIRAERWLAEWPLGNTERPRNLPDYVREYLNERGQNGT